MANYYPENGKIRNWFVEAHEETAGKAHYKPLKLPPVEQAHNGYFATTAKGDAKDTRGNTKANDEAYELIMKDKERLLDLDEPLRFVFSHSALREGWDNPNVLNRIGTMVLSDTPTSKSNGRSIGSPTESFTRSQFWSLLPAQSPK